jgi:hypothetical protein
VITPSARSSETKDMLNPWMFGLEAVQQVLRAQSALAFRLMRSFAGGFPDQIASSPLSLYTVANGIKAHEEVAVTHEREAPAVLADTRRRKAPKVLRASKKTSPVKAGSPSKRAAAASQKSSRKAVRRSARKRR